MTPTHTEARERARAGTRADSLHSSKSLKHI